MQTIYKDQIEVQDTQWGVRYYIVCPLCDFMNLITIPINDIKAITCENKKCQEYLKIVHN